MKTVVNIHNHNEHSPIIDVHTAEEKLEKLRSFLESDPCSLCENCEAMKCYGSLYPICEPMREKILELLSN